MRRDSKRARVYLDGSGPLFLVRGRSIAPSGFETSYKMVETATGELVCSPTTAYTTAVA